MKNSIRGRAFIIPILLAGPIVFAQRGRPPVPGSASVRPTGSSLGTIRLGGQDEKIWFGWRVGIPSTAFAHLTFSEAAARADALGLGSIEGFDTQTVSPEVPKNLDYNLYTTPAWEQHILAAVQYILGDLAADATPSGGQVKDNSSVRSGL